MSSKKFVSKGAVFGNFLWSLFSRIWTEYGVKLRISSYSVQMRENTDKKKSEYGHFSRSASSLHEEFRLNTQISLM